MPMNTDQTLDKGVWVAYAIGADNAFTLAVNGTAVVSAYAVDGDAAPGADISGIPLDPGTKIFGQTISDLFGGASSATTLFLEARGTTASIFVSFA